MSQLQWEYFLASLAEVEVKYWRHLRGTPLKDCYTLHEDENGVLSFEFNKDCDLAEQVKDECYRLFEESKVTGQQDSRRQA